MKLMIIDDDDQIREGMAFGIQWENLGIRQVECLKNGKEALEYLKEQYCDIIISDISMPIMSGVELMKQVRREYPEIRFILISGYKEFEYAQAGIRYGADGYILKPIHLDELIETVTNVIRKIDKNHEDSKNRTVVGELGRNQMMKQVIQNQITNPAEILDFLITSCGFEKIHILAGALLQADGMVSDLNTDETVKVLLINKITEFLAGYTYAIFYISSNEVFILVDVVDSTLQIFHLQQQMRRILTGLDRELPESGFSMGISEIGYVKDISNIYGSAKKILEERFFYGRGVCLDNSAHIERTGKGNGLQETHWNDQIKQAIEQGDESGLDNVISECKDELYKNEKEDIQKFIFKNMIQMSQKCMGEIQEEQIQSAVFEAINFNEMIDVWRVFLSELIRRKKEEQNYSHDICRAIGYIRRNYMEKITAEQMAEYLEISSGHFSRTFKQQVGISFVKYLNQYRIDKAEELLLNTNLKVYEVAERVGIPDYMYFTQVFRNLKGKAPTEVRR